ncbi:MAG TPA: bifunctional metallophosphatase/5'-nucleotidase [Polyangiaceae bacterium]|nr:bifunctional metallophosphatase/5'-nucleotidase [Polyangiaceae bacterium]
MRVRPLAAFLLLLAACALGAPVPRTVRLRLIAFNDFHGHIETAASLATAIRWLERGHAHTAVVAAGDLIGASPLASALFADEPTVKALSDAGLALSAAGNHEFDHGRDELLRLQRAARFHWLAANVFDTRTGKTLLPAYEIREYEGVRVAFVGAVLRSTPQMVMASGVKGLEFRDEAASVNALVPALRREGVEAIVLLIHEGGRLPGRYDDPGCAGFDGPIVGIVRRLDPAIDVVVSGHTHEAYACRIGGRLVTSASSYGRMVATIDLTLDRATRDVSAAKASLVMVDPGRFRPDRGVQRYVDTIARRAAPHTQRKVGVVHGELTAAPNPAGQSSLGQFVADAQLAAMREAGAQVAFANAGGLRAPLAGRKDDGDSVTFGDLHAAQPFGNTLVAMTVTGAQIVQLLEQQWRASTPLDRPRLLAVSRGFEYEWNGACARGHRIVAHSVRIDGRELVSEGRYRIAANDFLVEGGEGYGALRQGIERAAGPLDVAALERYVAARETTPGAADDRVRRSDIPSCKGA